MSNAARSFVFGLSGGRGIPVPKGVACRRYYQQLTRFSTAFALSADVAMAVLGGTLKRREKISGRLADVLSLLYLGSATMKRFADDGRPVEDLPLVHWAMQDALYQIQQAFVGMIQNFPNPLLRGVLSGLIFPTGKNLLPPSDQLGHEVATLLMKPGPARDRLTAGIYLPVVHGKNRHADSLSPTLSRSTGEGANESLRDAPVYDEQDALGALEAALDSTLLCEPLQDRLRVARKEGRLKALEELLRIAEARDIGIITAEQALQLERDYALRRRVIMVDDFAAEELQARQTGMEK
jgi:acyl-CoA dehydrogenase